MSRLASVAAAGYFPTPDRVVESIARHLALASGSANGAVVRVLDPCCGTGAAVASVTESLGGKSYGIEYSSDRSEVARTLLDNLIPGTNAFGTKIKHKAFSVLFLNPPYDQDSEENRLEHRFLKRFYEMVAVGGVLVYIVPQAYIRVSAMLLASHFGNLKAFRFPDPEYAAFGQMVLFGVRKSAAMIDLTVFDQLRKMPDVELPILPDFPVEPAYRVPGMRDGEVLFAPLIYDAELALAESKRAGVWVRPEFRDTLMPPTEGELRPLMPFLQGHLVMLIAAGLLNDSIIDYEGERLLVKGRITKVMVDIPTEEENTRIQREKQITSLIILNLNTWEFITVTDSETFVDAEPEESQAA